MTIVDLTEFFSWTCLLHLVRALIAFNTSHTILKNKYNTPVTFFSIVGTCMLYSGITINIPITPGGYVEFTIAIVYYIVIFAVLCFVTKGNSFQKFLATLFSFVNYMLSTLVYSITASLLFGKSAVSILSKREVPILLFFSDILFVFAFSFVLIALIKYIKTKTDKSFNCNKKYIWIFMFPITHIFSSWMMFYSFFIISDPIYDFRDFNNLDFSVIILTILSLILDFTIIFIADYFEKIEEENITKEHELVKNTMDYHQMLMMKQEKQEFRKIKHDFANIITTAKGFIEIGKPKKALSILSNTNEDLMGFAGFSVCSNETINTVLYIKQQQAEKNNIDLDIEIEESCAVRIDDYDLCRLLHNIIDNALNAVSALADDRYCKILIEINNEKLTIKTENKYKSSKAKSNKKSDKHGNGTGIIKNIASKYNGKYTYNQINNVWNSETFLNNKKPANSTPPEFGADFRVIEKH